MCCCGKPVINGEIGYRWQPNDEPGRYPPNAPMLDDRDVLLFDEPGRCGGQDSHPYHYCVVRSSGLYLYVRHGGGDERIRLSNGKALALALASLDSDSRYWILNAVYHAQSYAARDAREIERNVWKQAAADKRIKTRKMRGSLSVKVWIEPKVVHDAS